MTDFSAKITSRKESSALNSMESNYYRYVTGRIYNADKSYYRTFKFVVCIDSADVWESVKGNGETYDYTTKDVQDCLNQAEWSIVDLIRGYDLDSNRNFYEECQSSLSRHYRAFKYEYVFAKGLMSLKSKAN